MSDDRSAYVSAFSASPRLSQYSAAALHDSARAGLFSSRLFTRTLSSADGPLVPNPKPCDKTPKPPSAPPSASSDAATDVPASGKCSYRIDADVHLSRRRTVRACAPPVTVRRLRASPASRCARELAPHAGVVGEDLVQPAKVISRDVRRVRTSGSVRLREVVKPAVRVAPSLGLFAARLAVPVGGRPVDAHGVPRRPRRVVVVAVGGEQRANLLARASQLGERGDGVDGERAVADHLLVARHRRALVPGAPVRLGEGHGDGQGSGSSRDGFEFGQRRAVLAQGEVASADLELEGRLVHRPRRRRRRRGRRRRCDERGGVLGGSRGGHAARRGRRYPGRRGGLRRAHRRG